MRTFFNILEPYHFEWNDLCAGATLINVILIIIFGLSISWFGLFIAIIGLVKDFTNTNRHFNDVIMHTSTLVLNSYFLLLYYGLA